MRQETDRQTDRQKDRQIDRETESQRQTEITKRRKNNESRERARERERERERGGGGDKERAREGEKGTEHFTNRFFIGPDFNFPNQRLLTVFKAVCSLPLAVFNRGAGIMKFPWFTSFCANCFH